MRILVTGGAGFIGSHIVEHFQNRAEIRSWTTSAAGYEKYSRLSRLNLSAGQFWTKQSWSRPWPAWITSSISPR